jgi:hypothetical protein
MSLAKTGMALMKLGSKEVPRDVKSMLQPRASDSYIVNADFMRIKGSISIVNFYEQMTRSPLNALVR